MKHPFSAWVQMAFLSDMTRVPVPVGPTIVDPIGATIHCEIAGERRTIEVTGAPAVTYIDRDGESHLRPKLGLIDAILDAAEQIHSDLEERIKTLNENSPDVKMCRSQLDGMQELLTKLDVQQKLLEPFVFNSVKTFGNISTEFLKDASRVEPGKKLSKAITILVHPIQ